MKKLTASLLLLILALFMLPLLLLLAASFFEGDLIAFLKGAAAAPQPSLGQYSAFFVNKSLLLRFFNSAKITLSTLALQLPVSLLGGLFLARSRIKGIRLLKALLLILLLLPFQSIMVPIFKLSRWINLYDTQAAVILLQAFFPLGPLIVWLLIRAVPLEQWEAALLDCRWQTIIFFRVILPQLLPGLTVLLLLCFAEAWNMIEAPLILLPSTRLQPASLSLNDMNSRNGYAEALLYSLPILLLYGITSVILRKTDELTV